MSSHQIVPKDVSDSIEELYEPYILRGEETTFRIEEIRQRYPNFVKKAGVVQSEPTKSNNSRDLTSENFQKNDSRNVYSAVNADEEDSDHTEKESSNISV
jgi:hypothetical protein